MKEKVKIASRNDYLRVNTANFLENEKKYAELTRDPIRQNLLSDQNYYQNLNKMFHDNTNVFLTNEQKYHNAQNENDAKLKLRQNLTQKRIGSHTPGVVVQEHIIREYITTKDNTLPRQGSEEVLKLRGSHEKLPGEAKSYVRSGKNRESYEIAQKINPFVENPNFVLKETDKFLTDVQDYSHKQNEEFAKNPAVKSPKTKSKSRDNLFDNIKTKTAKLFRSTSNPKGDKAKKAARQQFEETKNATQNFLNDHQNFSHSQNEEFTIFTNKSKSPNTPKPELGTLKNGITYEKVIPTGSEKDSKSTTQEKEDIVTKTENKKVGNKEIVTRTEITTQTTRNMSTEESVKKFTVNVKNQQELEDIINNIFDDNVMTGQTDVLDFGAPKTPTTPRTPTTPKSTTSTAPKSPAEPKTSTTLKSSTSPNSSTTLTSSKTTKTAPKMAPQPPKTDEPHLYQNVWGNSKAPDSDEHAYENVKFPPPSTIIPSDKNNTKENIFYEFMSTNNINFLNDLQSYTNYQNEEFIKFKQNHPEMYKNKSKNEGILKKIKTQTSKLFHGDKDKSPKPKKLKTNTASPVGSTKKPDVELSHEFLHNITTNFLDQEKLFRKKEEQGSRSFFAKNPNLEPYTKHPNLRTTQVIPKNEKYANAAFLKNETHNFLVDHISHHNLERKEYLDYRTKNPKWTPEKKTKNLIGTLKSKANKMFKSSENLIEPDVEARKVKTVKARNKSVDENELLRKQTKEFLSNQKQYSDTEKSQFMAFTQKNPELSPTSQEKQKKNLFGTLKSKTGKLFKSKENISTTTSDGMSTLKRKAAHEKFLKDQEDLNNFMHYQKVYHNFERKEHWDFLRRQADLEKELIKEPVSKTEATKQKTHAPAVPAPNQYENYYFLKFQTEELIRDQKAHHDEERKEFLAFLQKHPEWCSSPKKHQSLFGKIKTKAGSLLKHSSKDNVNEPEAPVRKSKVVTTAASSPKKDSPYENDDFLKKQTIAFLKDAKNHSNAERKEYLDFIEKHPKWSPTSKKQQSLLGILKSKTDNLLKSKDEPKVEKAEKSKPLAASRSSQKENPYESYQFLKKQTEALIKDQKAHHNEERKEFLAFVQKHPEWSPTPKKHHGVLCKLKSKTGNLLKHSSKDNLTEPEVPVRKSKVATAAGTPKKGRPYEDDDFLKKQTIAFIKDAKKHNNVERKEYLDFVTRHPNWSPTPKKQQSIFGKLKSKADNLLKSKDEPKVEKAEKTKLLTASRTSQKENPYESYGFLKNQTEALIRDQKAHHDEERREFLAFVQKHPEWCSSPKKHQSLFGKIKTKAGSLLKHSSKDNVNEPEAPVRKSKVVTTAASSPKKGSPYENDDFLKKQTIAFLKDAKNHSNAERKEYLDFIEKHPKCSPTSKKQQSLLGKLKSKADNLLKSKDEPKVEKAEKSKPLAASRSSQKENPYESYQFLKNQTEALIKDQKAHHNEERIEFLAFMRKHPEWSPTPKKHHGVLCKLKSKTGNLLKHSSKDNLTEPEVPVRKSKVATAAGSPKKGSPYENDDFLKKQTIAFIKDAKKHSNAERKEYLDFVAKHPNWSPTPKKQQSIFGKLKSKADNLLKSKDEPKVEKAEKSKPFAALRTSQKENPYESYGFLKNQTEALIKDQKAHHDEERKEFLAFVQKHPEWCSSPKKHQSLFGKIKTKAGSLLKHSSKDNVNEPEAPVGKTKVATAADSPKKLSLYENDDFLKKQTIAFLKDAKNHSNVERKEYLDFIEKHPKWSPTSKKQQSLLEKLKSKADNLLKSKDEPKIEKAEKSTPLAALRSPQKENPYESYQFLKNQTEALIKDQKAHHNEERKEFLAFVQKHPEWSPTPKKHHGVLCKLKSKTGNLLKHSSKDNLTEPEVPVRKSKVATAAGTPKKGSPYEDDDFLKKQTIAFIKDAKKHSNAERKEYLDFLAKHPQWSPSPKKHQSVFGKIKNILKSPKDSSKEAEVKAKKTKGSSATPSESSPYDNPEFLKNATSEFLQKQKYLHDQERKEYNDYKARNPDWEPYAQKRITPTAKSVQDRKKIISLPQDIYKDYIFLHDQTALFLDEQKTYSDHYWLEVQDHNKKHPQKPIPKSKKGLLETVKSKILKPQEHEPKPKKKKPSLEEDPYKNPAFLCGQTEEFLREQKLHDDVQKTEYMKFKARSPVQGVKKQNKVTFGDVKHNAPSKASPQLQETHFGREPVQKSKTEVQETHFSSGPVQKVKTQLLTQPERVKQVHETHFDAEPIQTHPEHLKRVQETHFSTEPVQKIKAQMLPSPDHVKDGKKEQLIFLGNINLRDLTALKMLTVMFLENERSVGNENMILSAKYKTSHPQWFAPPKEHKKIMNVLKSKAEKLFSHKEKASPVKDDDKYKNLDFLRQENKTFLDDNKKYHDTERLGVNTFEKSNPQLVKTWRKITPTLQEPLAKKTIKEKILGSIKGSPKTKSEHEQFEKLLKDTRTFLDAEKSYANHEKEGLINFMSNQVLHTDLHAQKIKKDVVVPKVSRQQTFEFLQYEKDWANMVKMENLLDDANNKKTPLKTAEKNAKPLEKGAKTSLKSKVSSTIKKITPTPTKTSERRASLEKTKAPAGVDKKPPKPKETLIKIEVEQKPRGRIFTPPPAKQKSPTKLEGPKKFELKRPSSLVEKRKSSDITLTSKNKAHSKDDQKTGAATKVENNLLKNKYYSEKNIRTETHEETVENFSTRTNKKEIVIGQTPQISKSVESLLDNNNLRPSTRFVTTCYIKPERRPVWFSESLLVDMDSKEKKFDEKVQYDNKLQPHFWSETMTTNVFSRTETYKSEKVVTVEETARYISLEDLHKSK